MTEETDKLIEQRLKHLEEQIDILIKMHKPKEEDKKDYDMIMKQGKDEN